MGPNSATRSKSKEPLVKIICKVAGKHSEDRRNDM